MAENETNGTDLLAALSKQLESQQATIEKLNQQMLDQIALTESNNQTNQVNLNSMFLILMGALVMFMQCGFGFLEAGSVRSKNVTNILIKNVLDLFGAGFIYWAFGWGFAYGDDEDNPSSRFIGVKGFFATHQEDVENFEANWFFQMVFAATASTIVNGAIAERVHMNAYLCYSLFITGFVYPVITHWTWSGTGWLANPPASAGLPPDAAFMDFAGSGIVHCTGGIAALVACILMGPRLGRYQEIDGRVKSHEIPGHSVPFTVLGGFILMLGFFAFNGGSELAIVSYDGSMAEEHGVAFATAVMNTMISGSAGGLTVLVATYMKPLLYGDQPYWSVLSTVNGGLAGMVTACAGCNNMASWAAFVTGILAGLNYLFYSKLLVRLQIDDLLDAFPVHFGGGVMGLLMAPIFTYDGLVYYKGCYEENGEWVGDCNTEVDPPVAYNTPYYVFAWNLCGLVCIAVWVICTVGPVLGLFKAIGMLRVTPEIERKGMDTEKHNEPAYPSVAQGHGYDNEIDGRIAKNTDIEI